MVYCKNILEINLWILNEEKQYISFSTLQDRKWDVYLKIFKLMPTNETWHSSDPWKETRMVLSIFIFPFSFNTVFFLLFWETPLIRVGISRVAFGHRIWPFRTNNGQSALDKVTAISITLAVLVSPSVASYFLWPHGL